MHLLVIGSPKTLVAKNHTGGKATTTRIRCPRQRFLSLIVYANRRKDAGASNRRPRRGSAYDGTDSEHDDNDDGAGGDGSGGGQQSKYAGQLYGISDVNIADDTDPDAVAIAEFVRAKQLAAMRRARLNATADAAAAVQARGAGLEDYLSTQGLGSISQFREIAEQEAQRTVEELKEADLAALEAQIIAQGGDLEADWAALESARSTTGLAKSGPGVRGSSRGPSLPDNTLLAPPSNPRVDRLRSKTNQMRRKRRLFDPVDGDGSLYDDPPSGSGSDDDSTSAYDYRPQSPLVNSGNEMLLRRPSGRTTAADAPASRAQQLPFPPTANPFLSLPRRPSDALDPMNDVEAILDRMMDSDLAVAQLKIRAESAVDDRGDEDDRYDDDGYDEYGNLRPGVVDPVAANDEYADRMLRGLRGALKEKPKRVDGMEGLAARPTRPGSASGSQGMVNNGTAGRATNRQGPAAAPEDYDALAELLESVGEELEKQGATSAGLDGLDDDDSSNVIYGTGSTSPSSKRPLTTTELLRSQGLPAATPGASVARPQLLGRPTAVGSTASRGGASGAFSRAATGSASGQRSKPSAFAASDAQLLEDLLSDAFLSDLIAEKGNPERRQLLRDFLGADVNENWSQTPASRSARVPSLESKPTARGRTAGAGSARGDAPAANSNSNSNSNRTSAADPSRVLGTGGDNKTQAASRAATLAQAQKDQEELLRDEWDADLESSVGHLSDLDLGWGPGDEAWLSLFSDAEGKRSGGFGAAAAEPMPQLMARPPKQVTAGLGGTAGPGRGGGAASGPAGKERKSGGVAPGDRELVEMLRGLDDEEEKLSEHADDDWEAGPRVTKTAIEPPSVPLMRPVRGSSKGVGGGETAMKGAERSVPVVADAKSSSTAAPSTLQYKATQGPNQMAAAASILSDGASRTGRQGRGVGMPQHQLLSTVGGPGISVGIGDAAESATLTNVDGLSVTSPSFPAKSPAAAAPMPQSSCAVPADKGMEADPNSSGAAAVPLEEALAVLTNPIRAAALARLEGKPLLSAPPPRQSSKSTSIGISQTNSSSSSTGNSKLVVPELSSSRQRASTPARAVKASTPTQGVASDSTPLQTPQQAKQAHDRPSQKTYGVSVVAVSVNDSDVTVAPHGEAVPAEVHIPKEASTTPEAKSRRELEETAAAAVATLLDAGKVDRLRGFRSTLVEPEACAVAVAAPPARPKVATPSTSSSTSLAAARPSLLTEAGSATNLTRASDDTIAAVTAAVSKPRTWTRTPAVRPWRPGRAPLPGPSGADSLIVPAFAAILAASDGTSAKRSTAAATTDFAPVRAASYTTSPVSPPPVASPTAAFRRQRGQLWDSELQLDAPPASRPARTSPLQSASTSTDESLSHDRERDTSLFSSPSSLLSFADRLKRVRLLVMRGELVEGFVDAKFDVAKHQGVAAFFPKLARLGVAQPVWIWADELLGWRCKRVAELQTTTTATTRMAVGPEAESSDPQLNRPGSHPGGPAEAMSGASRESGIAGAQSHRGAVTASRKRSKLSQPYKRIWAAVTSVRALSDDEARFFGMWATMGDAEGNAAAAPEAVARLRGAGNVSADAKADLAVQAVEVLAPVPQRWSSLSRSIRREVLDFNHGRSVPAEVLAITERGAYCEVKLEAPRPTLLKRPEESAVMDDTERQPQGGAATGVPVPALTGGGGTRAMEPDVEPWVDHYSQLCFLPVDSMEGPLASDWLQIVYLDKVDRVRSLARATGGLVPLLSSRSRLPFSEWARTLRPGDMLECRLEGSVLMPVSVVLGLMSQIPHRASPALLEALDLTPPRSGTTSTGVMGLAAVADEVDKFPPVGEWRVRTRGGGPAADAAIARSKRPSVATAHGIDLGIGVANCDGDEATDGTTAKVHYMLDTDLLAEDLQGSAGPVEEVTERGGFIPPPRPVVLAFRVLGANWRLADKSSGNVGLGPTGWPMPGSCILGPPVHRRQALSAALPVGAPEPDNPHPVEQVSAASWVPLPRGSLRRSGGGEQGASPAPTVVLASVLPKPSGSGGSLERPYSQAAGTLPAPRHNSAAFRAVAMSSSSVPPVPLPRPSRPSRPTHTLPDGSVAVSNRSGAGFGSADNSTNAVRAPAISALNAATTTAAASSTLQAAAQTSWSWDPALKLDALPSSRPGAAADSTAAAAIPVMSTNSSVAIHIPPRLFPPNMSFTDRLKRIRLMVMRGDLVEGYLQGPYDITRHAVPAVFPGLASLGVAQSVWIPAGNLLNWRKAVFRDDASEGLVAAAPVDAGDSMLNAMASSSVSASAIVIAEEEPFHGEEGARVTGHGHGDTRQNVSGAPGRVSRPTKRIWVAVTSVRAAVSEAASEGEGVCLDGQSCWDAAGTAAAKVRDDLAEAAVLGLVAEAAATAATVPHSAAEEILADLVVQVEEVMPPWANRWASGFAASRQQVIASNRSRQVDTHVLAITERGVYCELQLEAPVRQRDRPRGFHHPLTPFDSKLRAGPVSGVPEMAVAVGEPHVPSTAADSVSDAQLMVHHQLAFLPRESMATPLATAWPHMVAVDKEIRACAIARTVGDSALLAELSAHRKFDSRADRIRMGDVLVALLDFAVVCVCIPQLPVMAVLRQAPHRATPELMQSLDLTAPGPAATAATMAGSTCAEAAVAAATAAMGVGPEAANASTGSAAHISVGPVSRCAQLANTADVHKVGVNLFNGAAAASCGR